MVFKFAAILFMDMSRIFYSNLKPILSTKTFNDNQGCLRNRLMLSYRLFNSFGFINFIFDLSIT